MPALQHHSDSSSSGLGLGFDLLLKRNMWSKQPQLVGFTPWLGRNCKTRSSPMWLQEWTLKVTNCACCLICRGHQHQQQQLEQARRQLADHTPHTTNSC